MDKGLDYYKNIQYDVVVRKKGDRYIVFIPELSLAEEDTTLNQAYEKLEKEKENYFRKMIEWGYQDYIRKPGGTKKEKKDVNDLSPFFIKFAIVLITLLMFFAFTGMATLNVASELIKNKVKTLLKEPDRFLVKFNEMMANKTDEQKEELKRQVRHAVENIKPYADELGVLFKEDNSRTKKIEFGNKH